MRRYQAVKAFDAAACVIVKHANPCGVATARHAGHGLSSSRIAPIRRRPSAASSRSTGRSTKSSAEAIVGQQFAEVIVAPEVGKARARGAREEARHPRARDGLADRIGAARAAELRAQDDRGRPARAKRDDGRVDVATAKVVTRRQPTATELRDLKFAWTVVKYVKSNAIVLARDGATIGIGAGQPSRVMSARIAALKAEEAKLDVAGAVLASDAFFPFRDGIDAAAERGVRAVVQPGGSMRDDEVIRAADEHGIAMVFTGMRHFRH